MTLYSVVRKSDGVEVYRYGSDVVVEWIGMEFATHDHTEQPPVPVEPPAPPPSIRITKLAFRNRFTPTEKAMLELVAADNPVAPTAQRQMAAALRATFADQRDAQFIDLSRPDTRAGVQQLEALGLLAAGRAAGILDTPPTAAEVWHG